MASGREELLQIAADIFEIEKGETWGFTATSSGLEVPHYIWEAPEAAGRVAIRSIQFHKTRTDYEITWANFVARDPDGDLIVGLKPGSVHDDSFTKEFIIDPFRAFLKGHSHTICQQIGGERRAEAERHQQMKRRAEERRRDRQNLGAA